MTREQFDALIHKLEAVSQKNPRLYVFRVAGMVALAYAYLLLILLGSLAMCVLMIVMVFAAPATIKLAIIGLIAFGSLLTAVLRGMWVKLKPPTGQEITRADAPKLFALLDELRAGLNCAPFHKVLMMGDINAGVIQIPRLGIFGWHQNYLLIGLPLMQSLSPEEFKAVLAHEFAHSSRGHGRFGNWLYRVRRTWEQIFDQMARRRTRWGAVLLKFINWFWPLFNGHVFVLARANEYEADACSVRFAGADATASALTRVKTDGALTAEKFWPEVHGLVKQLDSPPDNVMLRLAKAYNAGAAPDEAARWMRHAFQIETNNLDTHPCLKDRLKAIGRLPETVQKGEIPLQTPPRPAVSAAEFFLAGHAEVIAKKISEDWRKAVKAQWESRHKQAAKLAEELSGMEKPNDSPPDVAQLWEKARKICELGSDAEAVPFLEQTLALDPKHAGANFVLARHYLQKDDDRGIALIEAAIASDPLLTVNGCNLLYAYYNRTGRREMLRPIENRVDEFNKLAAVAQQERALLTARDSFYEHGLTAQQIQALQAVFAAEPDIEKVAVARKKVLHFPHRPCFGVALKLKVPWYSFRSSSHNQQLIQRMLKQVKLPGNFIIFVRHKNLESLGAKIFAVRDSVVYRRAESK
jgi:Zn-dependent protease with chaperone function